ncbi:MAG: hypothetical protein QNK05_20540, partial [Myxococcota bacterium]|nr:hypothetical protein [Myxococcota bacterium]
MSPEAAPAAEPATLALTDRGPGRALYVEPDGRLYVGRGGWIGTSEDGGRSVTPRARLPMPWKREVGRVHRLLGRLVRHEVRALMPLSDGSLVGASRDGLFRAAAGEVHMTACRVELATSAMPGLSEQALTPPFSIARGPGDRLLFGEYDARTGHGKPVRIFVSDDAGRSFQVARVLEAGSVMHVHGLRFDAGRDHYWVFAGDYDHEPGIGMLSADLLRFEWFRRGEQRYRVCEAFDFGERLVYATDSNVEPNHILSLHKESGAVEVLADIEGSSLYGCRFGGVHAISTAVEPGGGSLSDRVALWISRDGARWWRVFEARKDRWPAILQFGCLVLPRGESEQDTLFVSGQALSGLDG